MQYPLTFRTVGEALYKHDTLHFERQSNDINILSRVPSKNRDANEIYKETNEGTLYFFPITKYKITTI